MNQEERLDYLVSSLCEDSVQYKELSVEKSDRRSIIRSLMNIRMPKPISSEFMRIQDEFLKLESKEKGIVSWKDLPNIGDQYNSRYNQGDKISIWQGDITRLQVDAIVNAANSQMLGCFVPCHKCIDNAIHSAAGIELREECNQYMSQKRKTNNHYDEPIGGAVVTKGYNLPCRYVIHTVGPIVNGTMNDSLRNALRSCYESCLKTAADHSIRTIAFCCISTGEFRFPNGEAAEIALGTIQDFLNNYEEKFDRIIINVYKNIDLEIYKRLIVN